MIKAGAIDKGMILLINNAPHKVAEREFVNPGKGSAFVRLKLKNLISGQVLKEVKKSQDNVEDIEVIDQNCQFLYSDGESYHFMDLETFEQFAVPFSGLEDKIYFMKEGDSYIVSLWDGKAIDIKIPYKMVFEVTEAPEAVKGDTVTGTSKTVTIETGLQVKAPIFIKLGEKIMINTETREYVERVNS